MAKKTKYTGNQTASWFKRPVSPNKPIPVDEEDRHHVITINGKEKKISLLSDYHLDMLIIDDPKNNKNNKDNE